MGLSQGSQINTTSEGIPTYGINSTNPDAQRFLDFWHNQQFENINRKIAANEALPKFTSLPMEEQQRRLAMTEPFRLQGLSGMPSYMARTSEGRGAGRGLSPERLSQVGGFLNQNWTGSTPYTQTPWWQALSSGQPWRTIPNLPFGQSGVPSFPQAKALYRASRGG